MGAAVDRWVVEVLLRQGLLRQQPVHCILLVEDLCHHKLLVDQLGTDGCGHQARVMQTGELGLSASRLTTVRRRSMRQRRHRRRRSLLRCAAGDRLLLLGKTQVVVVVVRARWGEVGQAVHFRWRKTKKNRHEQMIGLNSTKKTEEEKTGAENDVKRKTSR